MITQRAAVPLCRGNCTTVRNPYKLTSMPYGLVQLRRGVRTAEAGAVLLRWDCAGLLDLSSVSTEVSFRQVG